MASLMPLGSLNGLGANQKEFFNAAKTGNKKILKKLLESGRITEVDVKNELGQTPLFFACAEGNEDCVKFLLEKGANANETTAKGRTPLHAACFNGSIKSVSALIERGGDFRFHDKDQRTGKDWAILNPDTKKKNLMTEYIVKTRMFAMTHSGRDVLLEHQSSAYMRKPSDNIGSIPQLFRRLSSKGGGKGEAIRASASLMSLGYGKVYGGERGGTISTIPMIAESMLKHDDYGTTFMVSAFFVMEGMMMGPTKVSVKRLHHDPPKGGVVDHLIKECENIACLKCGLKQLTEAEFSCRLRSNMISLPGMLKEEPSLLQSFYIVSSRNMIWHTQVVSFHKMTNQGLMALFLQPLNILPQRLAEDVLIDQLLDQHYQQRF
ncbi:inactive serine/threonine-protein kinase TEX14-like [Watersipora subatra]|uniref:inactive serine/threonine-protein kinase TEX14-like n=1 Tax=Watersipora subatra TaxID=2589382 RepID=UPI00355B0A0D